jgi:hypothetical protein
LLLRVRPDFLRAGFNMSMRWLSLKRIIRGPDLKNLIFKG